MTIKNMALVEESTGLVLNTIVVDDEGSWKPSSGQILVAIKPGAEQGAKWDGRKFTRVAVSAAIE